MTPNRFLAVVDEEKCTGCGICVERCKFDAVVMVKASTPQNKSYVDRRSARGAAFVLLPANLML